LYKIDLSILKHPFIYFFTLIVLLSCGFTKSTKKMPPPKIFLFGSSDTLKYQLLTPLKMDKKKTYPLVIWLHGAGERGNDGYTQTFHMKKLFTDENLETYPCYVFVPQCPLKNKWVEVDWAGLSHKFNPENSKYLGAVMEVSKEMILKYPIDTNRMYIMGVSMGGYGTWDAISRYPDAFAAAVPICGGADTAMANVCSNTPLRVYHGALDKLVKPIRSQSMVKRLKAIPSSDVTYIEYKTVSHNAWDSAFVDKELLPWMFSKSKAK
jgi:predicted peptidase